MELSSSPRWQFLLGASFALALVGCVAAATVEVQCLPMVEYSKADQVALYSAYHGLPQGSILRRAITDYLALRDADRACQGRAR